MKNNSIIVLLSVLLLACCREPLEANKQLIDFDNSEIIFKKEVQTYSDGRPSGFYNSTKVKQKQLRLDSLETGFDGLQIRIWYDVAQVDKNKVVIITYKRAIWTAKVYNIDAVEEGKHIYPKVVRNLVPKTGWANFSNTLLSFKILTLPDGSDLPDCGAGGGDGSTYNVEISSKMHYRYYGYWEPQEYQNKCSHAKNMNDILNLLEQELGL